MTTVIFNSSLPRSGSTLLQNLLAQNPRFYCSPTSGLLDLLIAARQNYTNLDDFRLQDESLMRHAWLSFCRAGVEGFYAGITDKPVACDKSRGWIYFWNWLAAFMPHARVICCVRDIRGIVCSMERLHQANQFRHDPTGPPLQMVTIEQRVEQWLKSNPVGLSLDRLRDAVMKGNDRHFFILRYEQLVALPERTFEELYAYLGEPYFKHDFEHIEQVVVERDTVHRIHGLHTIRNRLSAPEYDVKSILSAELNNRILIGFAWFYRRFYADGLFVNPPSAPRQPQEDAPACRIIEELDRRGIIGPWKNENAAHPLGNGPVTKAELDFASEHGQGGYSYSSALGGAD